MLWNYSRHYGRLAVSIISIVVVPSFAHIYSPCSCSSSEKGLELNIRDRRNLIEYSNSFSVVTNCTIEYGSVIVISFWINDDGDCLLQSEKLFQGHKISILFTSWNSVFRGDFLMEYVLSVNTLPFSVHLILGWSNVYIHHLPFTEILSFFLSFDWTVGYF